MDFCCRYDGSINTPMLLPINKSFVLWQFLRQGCQKVRGMNVRELSIKFDTEDNRNDDEYTGSVPYDKGCSSNHDIYMCHYDKMNTGL